MRRWLYIVLFWPILAWAQWTPVDYQKWQNPAQPTQYQARIGGELANFDSSGIWKPIRGGWQVTGTGTGRHWVSKGDVLKVDVAYNGTTTFDAAVNGQSVKMTHKPNRVILENQQTGAITTLAMNFGSMGAPTVIGDTLRYSKFSGNVIYEIIKKNATVSHRITFNPACLSGAITAFNLLPSQPDIALSVESDYTFTGIVNPSGVMWESELKDFGNRYKLLMERQWAEWTDKPDSVSPEMVSQNWLVGKMRERMPMPKVSAIVGQNAGAKIWHNDAVSIGAAGIEDAYITYDASNYNYGAATQLKVFYYSGYYWWTLIRVLNVDDALGIGATISACVCSLYCVDNGDDGNASVYRIFKPWVEGDEDGVNNDDGDVTYVDWASDTYQFATIGLGNAGDDGVDNNIDDGIAGSSNRDRKATAESTVNVTTVNTWYSWAISAALAQGWYDLTINENGVFMNHLLDNDRNYFASSENATTANRPRFSFTYTTGGAPAGGGTTGQVIQILED